MRLPGQRLRQPDAVVGQLRLRADNRQRLARRAVRHELLDHREAGHAAAHDQGSRRRSAAPILGASERLHADGGRFELGLARHRVESGARQLVERRLTGGEVEGAPVERRERNALRERVDDPRGHSRGSAPRDEPHRLAVADACTPSVRRVQLDERACITLEQLGRLPRARHRVPLPGNAPAGEEQRVIVVGAIGRRGVRSRRHPRAPTGSRHAARAVQPCRAPMGSLALATGRAWPLQHALPPEPLVRDAGDVAEPALASSRSTRRRPRTPTATRTRRHGRALGRGGRRSPSRAAQARERERSLDERHPTFRVRHDAVLLGPPRRRQGVVGERRGLGRVVGVLADHQLRLLQSGGEALRVGLRDHGIRGNDPDRLHAPVVEGVRQLGGGNAGLG